MVKKLFNNLNAIQRKINAKANLCKTLKNSDSLVLSRVINSVYILDKKITNIKYLSSDIANHLDKSEKMGQELMIKTEELKLDIWSFNADVESIVLNKSKKIDSIIGFSNALNEEINVLGQSILKKNPKL